VNLGDHLCRSGYCPILGRLPVPLPLGCLLVAYGVVVGCFDIRELVEWLRASGVRAGSRDPADVGFHDSRLSEGGLSSVRFL